MSLALLTSHRLIHRSLHVVDRHLPQWPTRKTRHRPLPPSAAATMPDPGGSRGLVTSIANIRGKYGTTNYLAGTVAGGEDHLRVSTPA